MYVTLEESSAKLDNFKYLKDFNTETRTLQIP